MGHLRYVNIKDSHQHGGRIRATPASQPRRMAEGTVNIPSGEPASQVTAGTPQPRAGWLAVELAAIYV